MAAGRVCRKAWCLSFCLVLLASCAQEGSNTDSNQIPVMHFAVDSTRVGPAFVDSTLRVSFRPPVGFVPADSARHREIREQARQSGGSGDPLATDAVLLFEFPDSPALCRVGRFLDPPVGGMSAEWIERCRAAFARQVAPAEVRHDFFRINENVLAAQLLADNPQMVLFRILCQGPGPEPVLIDYLMPRELYEQQVRGVESSLGSLRMF